MPRKNSINSLLNNYVDLYFDVSLAATGNRYADSHDIRLVNLGPNALFGNFKLTSSGKHVEDISHVLVVSLMYKLKTSFEILMISLLVLIVIVIEDNES